MVTKLPVLRHGGYGVDWDAETPAGKRVLTLAEDKAAVGGLSEAERDEAESVLQLFTARRLPHGEGYIFPCMDPDYCQYCLSIKCTCAGVPIPGALTEYHDPAG